MFQINMDSILKIHMCIFVYIHLCIKASQVDLVVKNLTANTGVYKRHGFNPWVRKIPWRRAWQPTPVFLPGKSHGQECLVGYSPWGRKDSDMTEVTWHAHTCILYIIW